MRRKKPKSKQKAKTKLRKRKEKNPPDHPRAEYMVKGAKKLTPYREFGYNDEGWKKPDPNSSRRKRISEAKEKGLPPAPLPGSLLQNPPASPNR